MRERKAGVVRPVGGETEQGVEVAADEYPNEVDGVGAKAMFVADPITVMDEDTRSLFDAVVAQAIDEAQKELVPLKGRLRQAEEDSCKWHERFDSAQRSAQSWRSRSLKYEAKYEAVVEELWDLARRPWWRRLFG